VQGSVPSREYAESVAVGKGMITKNSVTKKLDYLVVADPDTMSGKAVMFLAYVE
jgi:hypothetical protein